MGMTRNRWSGVMAGLLGLWMCGAAPAAAQRPKAPAPQPPTTEAAPADGATAATTTATPTATADTAVAPASATTAAPASPDLAPIRAEFTDLMDAIVQLRARVAVLGRQLFQTRVRVRLHNRAGDTQSLAKAVITLDGAPIHKTDGATLGGDEKQVFDGFAAPGPHVLQVEVEQRARDNDKYRYDMRDTYRFEVVSGKATEVTVTFEDDSGIAEDFSDDGEGEYDVRTRVRVATRDLGAE